MSARFIRIASLMLGLSFSARSAAATPGPWASSYLGGSGDDSLVAGKIANDGAVIVAGTTSDGSTLPASPKDIGAGTGGFVARLASTATKIEWIVATPRVDRMLVDTANDIVIASSDKKLMLIAADGTKIGWSRTLEANVIAMAFASDGDIVFLDSAHLHRVGPDGSSERFSSPIEKSHPTGLAVSPQGDIFVAGDNNTNTGFEPWRSPFIYRFDAGGKKVGALYDWPGPAVRAGGLQLQADSSFRSLRVGDDGAIWAAGFCDGGNTVLTRDPHDLATSTPALDGACHSGPCFGWKGANKPTFVARIASDFGTVERASFFLSHQTEQSTPCACMGTPNGGGPYYLLPNGNDVIAVGATAYSAPAKAPWFPEVLYGAGYPALVTVFDRDLKTVSMSTAIPGTNDVADVDYRGGRLLLVGGAMDTSQMAPPAGKETWPKTVPALPAAGNLQAAFGGGKTDGYLFIACMTTEQDCGSAPPPVSAGMQNGGSGKEGGSATTTGGTGAASPTAAAESSAGCGCRTSTSASSQPCTWVLTIAGLSFAQARRVRLARYRR